MPKIVDVPGVGVIEFPDSMTDDQIITKAQELTQRVAPTMTPPEQQYNALARHVAPMVLPMAGQAAGGFLGGLATTPTVAGVPAGVLGGEMAGGALGEKLNQMIGLTEPSNLQVGLAGAAGPVARGIGAGGGALMRGAATKLPGAGVALRDWAGRRAQGFGQSIRPPTPSEELYKVVDQFNPRVDLSAVREVTSRIRTEQAPRAEFGVDVPGGVGRVIRKTQQALEPPKPTASPLIDPATGRNFIHEVDDVLRQPMRDFQDIRAVMRGINDKIGAVKSQGGEGFGEMMQLKRAFTESLERATDKTVGQARLALKAANKASRQEIASDTVTDIIQKNIQILEGRETISISAGKAIKQLQEAVRKDKFLLESFPKGELERIIAGLEQIRKLPLPGAPSGVDAGSKRTLYKMGGGAAAGVIIDAATGGTLGPAVSGAVGTLSTIGAATLISQGLATKRGTDLLLWALREGKGLNRPILSLIGAAARSETGETKWPPATE